MTLWPAWARRLQEEYGSICRSYRLDDMRVSLRIGQTREVWGQFLPQQRSIVIAEALIWQHPWSSVLEVLKHEMAHQWACRQAPDEPAHGPAFARACERLAVASWARGAQVEAPWDVDTPLQPSGQLGQPAMLDRLGKLLALADSDNPHEAASAAAHARRLCRQAAAPLAASAIDFVQVTRRRRRIDRVDAQLVALVTEHFGVEAVFVHTFDAVAVAVFVAVEFIGEATALPLAAHAYRFLWDELERNWRAFGRQVSSRGGSRRQAFMLGVLAGIGRKWAAAGGFRVPPAPAAAPGPATAAAEALVPLPAADRSALAAADQRRALGEAVRRRHPHLSHLGRRRTRLDQAVYAAGAADGARVQLFVPLGGGGRSQGAAMLGAKGRRQLLPERCR